MIVLSEAHLKRILIDYFAYYHAARPHQALGDNAPWPREIEPPERGRVVAVPMVGGLHHRYFRQAVQRFTSEAPALVSRAHAIASRKLRTSHRL